MSAQRLQLLLARLYTDERLLARFEADPVGTARSLDVPDTMIGPVGAIDRAGLRLAAEGYGSKRRRLEAAATHHQLPRGVAARAWEFAGRLRVLGWKLSRLRRRRSGQAL